MTEFSSRRVRVLTFVVLPALAVTAAAVASRPASGTRSGRDRVVRVEAKAFAFTPSTLTVAPGDRVTLELVSTDYVHGLHIEGYGVDVTADPGQPATVSFVADRPGTFRIRCSVPCGPLHPFMTGRLQVGPSRMFWGALLLAAAAILAGAIASPRRPGLASESIRS